MVSTYILGGFVIIIITSHLDLCSLQNKMKNSFTTIVKYLWYSYNILIIASSYLHLHLKPAKCVKAGQIEQQTPKIDGQISFCSKLLAKS